MEQYRLIGRAGTCDIDSPASLPDYNTMMKFVEYVKNEDGDIIGAEYMADYGHGYGFDNGTKLIKLLIGETFSFIHEFTSTTDGIWEDDFFDVTVSLIEIK